MSILLTHSLKSMAAKKTSSALGKIRIIIKAFEHKLVDEAVAKIVATAKDSGAIVVEPVPEVIAHRLRLGLGTALDGIVNDYQIGSKPRDTGPDTDRTDTAAVCGFPFGIGVDATRAEIHRRVAETRRRRTTVILFSATLRLCG